MNLIRNTLLAILIVQVLGFLYVKFFQRHIESEPPKQHLMSKNISLPHSSAYTDYTQERQRIAQNNSPQIHLSKTSTQTPPSPKEPQQLLTKIEPIHSDINSEDSQKELSQVIQKTLLTVNTSSIQPEGTAKSIIYIDEKPSYKKVEKKVRVKRKTVDQKVALYAKKLLGHKYVWGATGPQTYDCSGFTQKVFKKTAGIRLPRVSRDQAKVGKYIKYAQLKKGDMVFFDTEKHYTRRVNHVGIYLGNNRFIHASSAKKKVVITSFKRKPFYKKRFLWGRRVLKDSRHINIATLINKHHKEI